jgi:hypothetical protein
MGVWTLWPSQDATVVGATPARSQIDPAECLNTWGVTVVSSCAPEAALGPAHDRGVARQGHPVGDEEEALAPSRLRQVLAEDPDQDRAVENRHRPPRRGRLRLVELARAHRERPPHRDRPCGALEHAGPDANVVHVQAEDLAGPEAVLGEGVEQTRLRVVGERGEVAVDLLGREGAIAPARGRDRDPGERVRRDRLFASSIPTPGSPGTRRSFVKLAESGFLCRKAMLIYGFDFADRSLDPVIDAFEALARTRVRLGQRREAGSLSTRASCLLGGPGIRLGT